MYVNVVHENRGKQIVNYYNNILELLLDFECTEHSPYIN